MAKRRRPAARQTVQRQTSTATTTQRHNRLLTTQGFQQPDDIATESELLATPGSAHKRRRYERALYYFMEFTDVRSGAC